mmetsp:Transcript_19490/g.31351  ORF Transcript_19490/g.31351 Transcript_19490/m.31351 type:complete len:222 (+) Transcript_19490:102-767(+)
MSGHEGACPCAFPGLPPPRPSQTSSDAFTHSSAFRPDSTSDSGTNANAISFPPLPGSSSLSPINAISGAIFFTALITCCDALESAPISTFRTSARIFSESAASTSALTSFRTTLTRLAIAAFLASFAFFCTPSILLRSSAFTVADMKAASMSFRMAPAFLSSPSVSALRLSKSATISSNLLPSARACLALSLVTAVMRRIPLATAVSSTNTIASASAVLET